MAQQTTRARRACLTQVTPTLIASRHDASLGDLARVVLLRIEVAAYKRVTKNAASWYTPPVLEGKIAPRVKAGTGEGVARAKALWRLFAFWEGHADARRRILAGELDVVFPAGTFRWHRLFGFPREEVEAAFFESAAFS